MFEGMTTATKATLGISTLILIGWAIAMGVWGSSKKKAEETIDPKLSKADYDKAKAEQDKAAERQTAAGKAAVALGVIALVGFIVTAGLHYKSKKDAAPSTDVKFYYF